MSWQEILDRARDEVAKQRLRIMRSRVTPGERIADEPPPRLSYDRLDASPEAKDKLIATAEEILSGTWRVFETVRADMQPQPDWFLDSKTGTRAPAEKFSYRIQYRDPKQVGSIKYVWELSRHHHLTVLAAAYHATGDERFAQSVERHLRSWWNENLFLRGVHWASGIELGVRLISWTWIRRLLDGWSETPALFEDNTLFERQLFQHQYLLAQFQSHGSSANNHLIAEAAGLFVSTSAFPWFEQSAGWRKTAAEVLRIEASEQFFESGLNRELATDYHGFTLELLLLAALEGEATGYQLGADLWQSLVRMADALAAVVDVQLRPPRQGDGDDGVALLVDGQGFDRWTSLIETGSRLFGACNWWPPSESGDVRSAILLGLEPSPDLSQQDRPDHRPDLFPDAGLVVLRDLNRRPDEIWCRFDAGPHGYLSTAAHAHADALSIELRFGGRDILADPGTYSYHSEPEVRAYFRSTAGHNTLELEGRNQSVAGGPFNWTRHTSSQLTGVGGLEEGPRAESSGAHNGYDRLDPPATHRRVVSLDRSARTIEIVDRLDSDGSYACRLAFHLGPGIKVDLDGATAHLVWNSPGRPPDRAVLRLPSNLTWSMVEGRERPPAGWYSPHFGVKIPTVTLLGEGFIDGDTTLETRAHFLTGSTGDESDAGMGSVSEHSR